MKTQISFGMKNINDKYIIGISFGFHDSAVALIQNGQVLNAVEEERFTGIKHDNNFPINSINWILKNNNITDKGFKMLTDLISSKK